ncbi:MAG TPA: HAD family hydrolase [Thermomicrobiaceae bacterium]|nr:HAD family hydrolase [Thermomicrobiaceae bacterium]
MNRAVLFDWDDTLAAYRPHRYETVEAVLRAHGLPLDRRLLHRAWGVADDPTVAGRDAGFWARFGREIGLEDPLVLAALDAAFAERDLVKRLTVFEDALELLEHLTAREIPAGILSNNVEAARFADELGVLPRFRAVVTPREAGVGKPEPAIFHYALERLGTRPEETLYVGDTYEHDVLGARAAGLPVVLVDRLGLCDADDCARLASLAELMLETTNR